MIRLRPAAERGHADHGWLRAAHSFSFAGYLDPEHMGFRALRVINEDRIAPGAGFPPHPHRDMEILTYLISGALAHEDSMGHRSVIRAGEVQRMSAGRGVVHSEFNASDAEPLHLLQIWLLPASRGVVPSYEQKALAELPGDGALQRVVDPIGAGGALRLHQDVSLWAGLLAAGAEHRHLLAPGRGAWVQVVSGSVDCGGVRLVPGDGAAVEEQDELLLRAVEDSELLLFDLP